MFYTYNALEELVYFIESYNSIDIRSDIHGLFIKMYL